MTIFASPTAADQDPAIASTVQRYIDGYLGQETTALRAAFHPESKLMATDAGAVTLTPTADWFAKIDDKNRLGRKPLTARHTILGIDRAQDAAVAKVRLEFDAYSFTDYLSLLKGDDGWRIVNKIYTVEETPS